MSNEQPDYSSEYSDSSFWTKVKDFAIIAGREVIEKALILYCTLRDEDTPKWAKNVIIGALGYFIVPVDLIPDFTPGVGFADDLGALAAALAAVALYIKDDCRQWAKDKMQEWFGPSGGEPKQVEP